MSESVQAWFVERYPPQICYALFFYLTDNKKVSRYGLLSPCYAYHAWDDNSVLQYYNFVSLLILLWQVLCLANPFNNISPDKDRSILNLFLLAI